MTVLTNFTAAQRRELRRLGVCDQQMEALRFATVTIKRVLYPAAAHNDVAALLDRIADASRELGLKLHSLAAQIDSAHATAFCLVETGYWQGDRLGDEGPSAAYHLIPRLAALSSAAVAGKESLPEGPARSRTADWQPIKKIDSALLHGWVKAHGPFVRSSGDPESVAVALAEIHAQAPAKPYPKEFRPSSSADSVFRRIVGICYAAAGAVNNDPERAIKAYVSKVRKYRAEARAAIEQGNNSAKEKRK